MEGELQKRFWQIWTYDFRITDEEAEKMQDESNFNVRSVMKIVDEAKKEFPILPFETQLTHEVLLAYACDRANWFFKWFGEGDLEKSSAEEEKTS